MDCPGRRWQWSVGADQFEVVSDCNSESSVAALFWWSNAATAVIGSAFWPHPPSAAYHWSAAVVAHDG